MWSFPCWVAVFYLPLPRAVPKTYMLSLAAVFRSLTVEGWTSWLSLIVGTLIFAQAMNLTHSALWDAAEPFLIGNPSHGRGRQVERAAKKHSITDLDGRPLGPDTLLVPGTKVLLDGKPHTIPGQ